MAAGPPFIPAHCGVESLINEIQKTFTKIITRSNISVHCRYCLFMFIALGHIWFWHVDFIWQPKSALVGTNCCKLTLILKTLEIFCLLERWKWWWWFVVALLEGNVPCLINICLSHCFEFWSSWGLDCNGLLLSPHISYLFTFYVGFCVLQLTLPLDFTFYYQHFHWILHFTNNIFVKFYILQSIFTYCKRKNLKKLSTNDACLQVRFLLCQNAWHSEHHCVSSIKAVRRWTWISRDLNVETFLWEELKLCQK